MDNLHVIGTYLAHSTLLQLHVCLRALEVAGCSLAAAQVDAAIACARQELAAQAARQHLLFRPDTDFAEIDAMIDELFGAIRP
jgi:hypothetical protein